MTKTVNYNLKKPEPNDPLRVADFNENADILDAALFSAYSASNPPWEIGSLDLSSAAVGDVMKTFDFEPKAIFLFSATTHAGGGANGSDARAYSVSGSNYLRFHLSGSTLTLAHVSGSIGSSLQYMALK